MKNMKKIATAGAMALAFAGGGIATAGTAHAEGQKPTIHNWVWRLADGTVWGQCTDGYHPVWNRVGDPSAADYRLTNGRTVDGMANPLTWAQIEKARAAGDAWNPITVAFNDLEGRGEVSLGNDPAPADGLVYEGDCVTNGYTYPKGPYHGGSDTDTSKFVPLVNITRHHDAMTHEVDDTTVIHHDAEPAKTHEETVVVTPAEPAKTHEEPIYKTVVVPGTPAVPAETKTVTHPGTPAVTKQVPHMVKQVRHNSVTVQVDRYLPATAAQAATVTRLDDDNKLGYREDRDLWGHSNVTNVTVSDVDVARAGSVLKAVQAKFSQPVLGNVTSAKAGGSYLKAWCLAPGSTPGLGAWKGGAQTDVDACAAPKAETFMVQDGVDTVVVTPAKPATTETVVVTPAKPAVPETTKQVQDGTKTVVDAPAVPEVTETRIVTDIPAKPAWDETVITGHHTVVDHDAYDEAKTVGSDEVPAYEADGWIVAPVSGGAGG